MRPGRFLLSVLLNRSAPENVNKRHNDVTEGFRRPVDSLLFRAPESTFDHLQ